jgi:uncharacterized protein
MSNRSQRIRDPIHDLITFESRNANQLEGVLWQVMQKRPFQRLRRIKQLGFSEFVYPGATHTRFAHSIGVFHTARQLMEVVRRHAVDNDMFEWHSLAAALLHDVGHGPFSHAFEKVGKRLGLKFANHEALSVELITNGEITEFLNGEMGKGFAENVADILRKDGVKRVHHAVVSSQFDADRLDYVRRDRMMAGSQHAGIDFQWLIANLEIGKLAPMVDDQKLDEIETFVIGPKAALAAEAYVLGLFQLYPTIYLHKTTRGIEKLFENLLLRVIEFGSQGRFEETGLPRQHPLVAFAEKPDDLEAVLALDDSVVSGALSMMSHSVDPLINEYSRRIRDRKLLKCLDIRGAVSHHIDPGNLEEPEIVGRIDRCCEVIRTKLTTLADESMSKSIPSWLVDQDERSPYKRLGAGSKGPLDQIWIKTQGGALVNLEKRSAVVRSLHSFQVLRVYLDRDDQSAEEKIKKTIEEGLANVE